jgi:hypothetical protein
MRHIVSREYSPCHSIFALSHMGSGQMRGQIVVELAILITLSSTLTAAAAHSTRPLSSPKKWRVVAKECQNVAPPVQKIKSCLKLATDSRTSSTYLPVIYMEIAYSLADNNDYSGAIKYARMEIEHAEVSLKRNQLQHVPDLQQQADRAAMSLRYLRLGQFESLYRMTALKMRSDEARRMAEDEQNNYELAIQFDPSSHKAYWRRAQLRSLFCDSSAAAHDVDEALKLATRAEDDGAVKEYKTGLLDACIPEWRKQ